MPKISIITITYNNLEGLKRTIGSVVNQTWQEFEYIVIDGASIDGSALTDVVRKVCLNSSNDIILGGCFHNTIDFDPSISIFNRTAKSNDIFLLKLDSIGNFIWVKTLEGSTEANGYLSGLTIDVNQNFYLAGTFKDTVDFDPGAGTANLTSAG